MFSRTLLLLKLVLLLEACAGAPERLRRIAMEENLVPLPLQGDGFILASYYKPPLRDGDHLHVYLEGDGTPWLTPERIADDPTPNNPLMLRLMAHDSSAALYLARPCYNGHARDSGCSPALWTDRRYGPEVISSMTNALRSFLGRCRWRAALSASNARVEGHPTRAAPINPGHCQPSTVVFFGHSGGGVLALLVAKHFPQTRFVVTVAAPLDIDAWADHHGFSRLKGSINPADDPPATPFAELHYFGSEDKRVPPGLFRRAMAMRPKARFTVVNGFRHTCCWEKIWPEILYGSRASESGL